VRRGLERVAASGSRSALTRGHTYRCYAGPLLAQLGRGGEGEQHLDEFRTDLEAVRPGHCPDRWRWGQYLGHRALCLFFQGKLGAEFERVLAAHRTLDIKPNVLPLQLKHFYVAQAYGRLRQLEAVDAADAAARRRALASCRSALGELRRAGAHPTLRAHRLLAEALYWYARGRRRRADTRLAQAEGLAEHIDAPWVCFEVLRQRARVELAEGAQDAARRYAEQCHRLALAHGWVPLVAQAEAEFPPAQHREATCA